MGVFFMYWGISRAILGQQNKKTYNHKGYRLHSGDGGI